MSSKAPTARRFGLVDQEIGETILTKLRYALTLSNVIEALQKHVLTTPEKVGEIYLEIPESELWSIEQTQKNEVEETVRTLYKKGCHATAEAICERFAKAGALFLRSVHEEHQKP